MKKLFFISLFTMISLFGMEKPKKAEILEIENQSKYDLAINVNENNKPSSKYVKQIHIHPDDTQDVNFKLDPTMDVIVSLYHKGDPKVTKILTFTPEEEDLDKTIKLTITPENEIVFDYYQEED